MGGIKSGFGTLTATTDWNGEYEFTEIPSGVYYIKVNPVSNKLFTSQFDMGSVVYNINVDYPIVTCVSNRNDDGVDDDNNGFQTSSGFNDTSIVTAGGVGSPIFSYPFTLSSGAEPGNTNQGNQECTIDVGLLPCPIISVSQTTLPSATNGVAYNYTLTASGGQDPYTFSVVSGTLPPGITMSTTGVFTGTSTTNGNSVFTIRVTDALGCNNETTIRLAVCPPFSITTASSLPTGTEQAVYPTTTLAATGGTPPYGNWRVYTGALPSGLTISPAGVITGTPTTSGTYTFQVAVDDSGVTGSAVTVANPSFETQNWNGIPFAPQTSVTGWTYGNPTLAGTGSAAQIYGIHNNIVQYGNTTIGSQFVASPFVPSWMHQSVSGFTTGAGYKVRFKYALRDAFPDPPPPDPPPPFTGDPVSIAIYRGSNNNHVFNSIRYTTPPPVAQNFDTWTQLEFSFIPPEGSLKFAFDMEGGAIDDVQIIPDPVPSCTAIKTFTITINSNSDWGDLPDFGGALVLVQGTIKHSPQTPGLVTTSMPTYALVHPWMQKAMVSQTRQLQEMGQMKMALSPCLFLPAASHSASLFLFTTTWALRRIYSAI
ncbi:MAG: putative Ig domain-containing protein [Verrucomicrobiaceae bacterium]|nr:putative Ig domain-containing protein [Verrucomicrobiaceae bacterium]